MRAEKAQELANNFHSENQYKLIELNIAQESSKGLYKISWLNLAEHTKVLLRADGYKISNNGDGLYGPSYEISWEQ